MKFEEALKNYEAGYKSRGLSFGTESKYNSIIQLLLNRIEALNENGKINPYSLADMIIQAKAEAEREHLFRLFACGRDDDEPELAAVRHVEMALIDSYAERN